MSKNTDTVIRSLDASVIYYKGRQEGQIQKYLSMKDAYIRQKKFVESMKDKFTRDEKCSYSDVCMNVTFNSDVSGMTDKYIRDKNGRWIKHGKIKTSVIDSGRLRKLIYKNGFWMNGRHYVDYQSVGRRIE